MKVFIIDAPHFYAGAIVVKGKVTEAAPIINYMIGWKFSRVRSYCTKKNWKLIGPPIENTLIEF